MLDGLYKQTIDRFWERLARRIAACGLTPNQITWGGIVLVLLQCLFYPLHGSHFWLGLGLAFTFALDALDGAVARITHASSHYGGYLDAVADRYQEVIVYLTLAWVNDWWGVAFVVITGSLLTSYNKARTAVEISIDNDRWPDLLERMERLVILCAALIFDAVLPLPAPFEAGLLHTTLISLGVLTHLTAVQRFLRARHLLRRIGTDHQER